MKKDSGRSVFSKEDGWQCRANKFWDFNLRFVSHCIEREEEYLEIAIFVCDGEEYLCIYEKILCIILVTEGFAQARAFLNWHIILLFQGIVI